MGYFLLVKKTIGKVPLKAATEPLYGVGYVRRKNAGNCFNKAQKQAGHAMDGRGYVSLPESSSAKHLSPTHIHQKTRGLSDGRRVKQNG